MAPSDGPYLSRETISRTYCLGVTITRECLPSRVTITRKHKRRPNRVTMTRSQLLLYRETEPCRLRALTIPSDPYHLHHQDSVLEIDSPPGGDQQQGDAQQGLESQNGRLYPELQPDGPDHDVQQGALDHHPELKIRAPQVTLDTSDESEEELALMNIPEENVISTLLTVAAEETEPFEPKNLHQAKNDHAGSNGKRNERRSYNHSNKTKLGKMVDPPKDRRVLSGKWIFKLKRGPQRRNTSDTSADG